MDGRNLSYAFVYAIGCGLLLGQVVGLQPVWWLAWIAPAFLLLLGAHAPRGLRFPLVLLAALIASASLFPALRRVMPPLPAAIVVVLLALPWVLIVGETVRLRRRFEGAAWTALAFPIFAVAVDTLMARFLPDGNWNGYAYTQADVLPVAQLASLLGVPGLVFVLMLVPATLFHLADTRGRTLDGRFLAGCTFAVVAAVVAFGALRLRESADPAGRAVAFGLVAVDDAIGLKATAPYVAGIREAYARHVESLAASGARIVVLPEKIAVVSVESADDWNTWFAGLARTHGVWLLGSVSVAADRTGNFAWLYTPAGARDAIYQKHHLAPPERNYAAGNAFVVRTIDGLDYALGICKDMHFASFAREYGARGVAAALVPAWDFVVDADLARRMTALRGVENGYAIVRTSRDGLLSVSDAYGRTLSVARSSPLPGAAAIVRVRLDAGSTTLQSQIGDAFGWLCVALAFALAVIARRTSGVRSGRSSDAR